MSTAEQAFVFPCQGAELIGILHPAARVARLGVVLVVGGPQYRVGSHRQFVSVARAMAGAGFPVLRFDYRGMGDSEGDFAGFEDIDADIRAAVDALMARVPTIERVALWGLCDAASAILFHAPTDPRIAAIALINPWVRTPEGLAKTHLRHYYGGRLLSAELWRKIGAGRFDAGAALRSFGGSVGTALGRRSGGHSLPDRMAEGLRRFRGPALLILSGNDLTAQEFEGAAAGRAWKGLLDAARMTTHRLPTADHTFSESAWRDDVIAWTNAWLTRVRDDAD